MALVTRLTKSGKYIVLGSFDEVTKITVSGGGGGADANLGFSSSFWQIESPFFGDPGNVIFFGSTGTVTVENGDIVEGSGGWYTNGISTTGSNFEIQAERVSYTGTNSGTTLNGVDLSTNSPTSWFTIGSGGGIYLEKTSSGTTEVIIRIREIAVPSNITNATFSLYVSS